MTLWQVRKNIHPALTKNEIVLWDGCGLFWDKQVIKWIELICDLREIKHMFYPYLSFLNSVNSSLKLQKQSTKECLHVKQPLIAVAKPRSELFQIVV